MDKVFQVDLHGLVDLLSHHLYSSPRVFVRELLQNAVDAITARRALEPLHPGAIAIELIPATATEPATLVMTDDGIGLTRDEAETFLATIGRSSKREAVAALREDFLGQFGIGLLACFMVADEIVVVSRSARGGPAVEWRGRPDGTYSVRDLDTPLAAGTRVYLRARPDAADWFVADSIRGLLDTFGRHLPVRATLTVNGTTGQVTGHDFPWELPFGATETRERALRQAGTEILHLPVMDVLDIEADAGKVRGLAFVVGGTVSPVDRPAHRVYLKRMLLGESVPGLLPDWAFFIRAMVNTDALTPTASREQLYDDAAFDLATEELGEAIRDALVRMAADDPVRLGRIVDVHFLGLKALAVHETSS